MCLCNFLDTFGFTKDEKAEKNIEIRKRIEERKRARLDIFIKMMIFILVSLFTIHYHLEPNVFLILVFAVIYLVSLFVVVTAFRSRISNDKYAEETDKLIREIDGSKTDVTA